MTVEEKVLEKIRKVLYSDSVIGGYVKKRVYTAHISSISEPEYPAISLHLLPSGARFAAREFVSMAIQIDVWMQGGEYTSLDCYKILERIRVLLDRQHPNDTDIGVVFAKCSEEHAGSIMYEEDEQLLHLPVVYLIVAR